MTRRTLLGRTVTGLGGSGLMAACRNREGPINTTARGRSSFRIAEVRVHPVEMRRIYRTRMARTDPVGKEASLYLLIEFVTGDGTSGIGELSDIEPAWNAPAVGEFERLLSEQLVGADASDRHRLSEQVAEAIPQHWHVELRRMLWAAVDMALLDVVGKVMGVPAYELLGGRYRTHVPVSWVAYVRHSTVDTEGIEEKVAQGFRAFKLKVGSDLAADCDNVAAIRRIAGPEAYLKVDPSGTWGEEQAIDNISKLAEAGVDAVETPVKAASRDIAKNRPQIVNRNPDEAALSLARVRRAVPTTIIEHVGDFADAFAVALVRHQAVDIFKHHSESDREPQSRQAACRHCRGRRASGPAGQYGRTRSGNGGGLASRRLIEGADGSVGSDWAGASRGRCGDSGLQLRIGSVACAGGLGFRCGPRRSQASTTPACINLSKEPEITVPILTPD